MNRKVIKVISILMVVLMAIMTLSVPVFADTESDSTKSSTTSWKDISIDQFDKAGDKSGASQTATNIVGSIISIVQVVGMGIAIIMLIVMAIKYISAAPSEKAEIKKSATIYIVGAIVLFAASGILEIIKNFASQNIVSSAQLVLDMTKIYLG